MKCSYEQFKLIEPKLIQFGYTIHDIHQQNSELWLTNELYLVNNYNEVRKKVSTVTKSDAYNYGREVFDTWDPDLFINCYNIKYRTTITAFDLLEIHKVACLEWKEIIAGYLSRCTSIQTVNFRVDEINEMFKAATSEQKPILTKIFQPIDFDKIVVGSIVKLKINGQEVFDNQYNVNYDEPFYVLAYNVPFCVTERRVVKDPAYPKYNIFVQKGHIVSFSAHINVDYIVEVIEY